ncbi:MAG TPA: hypothetical protein VGB85_16725, partial [Nannocystis sp.]
MHRNFTLALPVTLLFAACTFKVGDLGELTEASATEDPSTSSATDPVTTSAGTAISGQTNGESGNTSGSEETGSSDPTEGLTPPDGVDILFVIDNSGSMAQHQQRLSTAIPALVAPLEAAGLDLRIAVTTTDAGNPRCPNATYTPEGGAFQARSCREAIADNQFKFGEDDFASSCLDACPHETITFSPTSTDVDPSPAVRPWIEWSEGAGNVAVPLSEAIGCVLPQGVAGCGFESPLEAMFLALSRAQDPADPAFGFLRTSADLLVVMVTDETDCSWAPAAKEIFTTNKVFWNDPVNDPAPTSALCWRAGIECSGGPGTYDDCVAVDKGLDGTVTNDPSQAVLQPISRYQGVLSTILASKQQAGSAAKVHVAAIAGVPVGYPGNPLVFADGDDAFVQGNYGIGPGCEGDGTIAVPPGRIREVVEQTAPL